MCIHAHNAQLCEKALAQLAQSILLPFWRLKESPKKPQRFQASSPLSEEHSCLPEAQRALEKSGSKTVAACP